MHLLTVSQGIATMMTTFGDEGFYQNEIQALKEWVGALARNRGIKNEE